MAHLRASRGGRRPGRHLDASSENSNGESHQILVDNLGNASSENNDGQPSALNATTDEEDRSANQNEVWEEEANVSGDLGEEDYDDEHVVPPALAQEEQAHPGCQYKRVTNEEEEKSEELKEEDRITKLERKLMARMAGLEGRLSLIETCMNPSNLNISHRSVVQEADDARLDTFLLSKDQKGEEESKDVPVQDFRRRSSIITGLRPSIMASQTEKELTEDTFSFMIAAPAKSLPFWLAIGVFFLQISVLALLGFNLVDFEDAVNPLQIPTNVTGAVRLGQFVAIFVAVILQNDLITCFDLMGDGFSPRLIKTFHHATKVKFALVTVCRFVEGASVLLIMFALIVSSGTVLDVLLNFTAVEFVSQFDEAFFFLSRRGYLGQSCEKEAWHILETTYYSPEKHYHRYRKILLMTIFFAILIGGWGLVIKRQVEGTLLCSTIFVQFGDDMIPELGTFSGFYDKQQSSGSTLTSQRVEYVERNLGRAKFAYCNDLAAWTFRLKSTSGDDNYDPCDWKARSSQEDAFDLTQTMSESWYIQDEFQRQIVLEPFFLSCYDCEASSGDECTGRGSCEDAVCSCDEGWVGPRCEYVYPCTNVATDLRFEGFPGQHQWSPSFELLIDFSSGKPTEVYNHPIYVNVSESGNYDVIFFTGRRWAATFRDYMPVVEWSANITNADSNETKRLLSEYFQTDFHAHWSDYRVGFLSGPLDHETPEDSYLPVGVPWFYADSTVRPHGSIHVPDIPVGTVLLCSTCNNLTNGCRFDGICDGRGVCQCSLGSEGSLCEITPVGNGRCDQFFNLPEFGLDGGDCCDATCANSGSNWCGTDDNSFTYTGYPFCKSPLQDWLANGDPIVLEKGRSMGYQVALSTSGNTLAVGGERTNDVINVYDKVGSTWRFRSSSAIDTVAYLYTLEIEIFEEDHYVGNRVSRVPVTVSVLGWSGHRSAEAFVIKCDKQCDQPTSIFQSDDAPGLAFDMINQNVYGTLESKYTGPYPLWNFTVMAFGVIRSYSIADTETKFFQKMRLADNGNVIGILYTLSADDDVDENSGDQLRKLCARLLSWNETDYTPRGAEVCLNQTFTASEYLVGYQEPAFALARNDGNAFVIMACGTKQLHLFVWNGVEWTPRESPLPNAAIQCVLEKRDTPYVTVEMSGDGLFLGISGLGEGEFADEVSTRIFKWTDSSWEEIGTPLLGGNSFSLSGNGLVAAVGSLENVEFDSVAVYSRPVVVCPSGMSSLHFSLTTDERGSSFNWFMLDAESREILDSGLAGPSYRTVAADVCLENLHQQCVEVAILDRQQQLDGIRSPGGYALYINGTRLPTERFGIGYMKQSWVGNCSFFSNAVPCGEAEGMSTVEIAAIMENDGADNLTWQLLDYYSGETMLEGGPYSKNTSKFVAQRTCLDTANRCFVFKTRNGYKRDYNGAIQDNTVDLVVDSRSVHVLGPDESEIRFLNRRNSVYIGPNGCCPAGQRRIQIALSSCNAGDEWTIRMPNGTLVAAGENSAEILEQCDAYNDVSVEYWWEDFCMDENLCYKVQGTLNVIVMSTFPTIDAIDQSDFMFNEALFVLGKNCKQYYEIGEAFSQPIIPNPISLTDGAVLSDQASVCPGCAQELRLSGISPGDIVTCMLEGDNGDADLYTRFGGVPLFGENPAVRANACSSETFGNSREACTTQPAPPGGTTLYIVVFARASYTDLTVQCSVTASQPVDLVTEAPSVTALEVETDEPISASSTQPHTPGSIVPSSLISTSQPWPTAEPTQWDSLGPSGGPQRFPTDEPTQWDSSQPASGESTTTEPTAFPTQWESIGPSLPHQSPTTEPSLSSSQPVAWDSTTTNFPYQSSQRPTADLASLLSESSDPLFLSNGIALPGQSSAAVGSVQEYRLIQPVASGDIATCTLKGDNGNADLFVHFGEPNIFVDGSTGCNSDGDGSNESCTTSATSSAEFLRAVVVATSSYTDVTILCSVK